MLSSLLILPMLALVALWGFAASITVRGVVDQRNYDTLHKNLGAPAQALLRELGQERLQSVMFLSGSATKGRGSLDAQRRRTDPAAALFRKQVLLPDSQDAYSPTMKQYADQVVSHLDRLSSLRSGVDAHITDRVAALQAYNDVIDAVFKLLGGISVLNDIDLYRTAQGIITAQRGLDMISRETALVVGAASTRGRLAAAEYDLFSEQAHDRHILMDEARSQMVSTDFDAFYGRAFTLPANRTLTELEDRITTGTRGGLLRVSPNKWQSTAGTLTKALDDATVTARNNVGERSRDLSSHNLFLLEMVGGIGLVAVVVSVVLSVRFGRVAGRELVELQKAAQDLAEVRLPDVVNRLRRSEDVDVSVEAPSLLTGKISEVARVAESFTKVQRTAIEAAVGQAELRKGFSQVYLNLARRNQSLLHRQLTMLDALESRAEPDVLEDLFRLDHLTTRMRRHAEGLIILSGAVPGRGWREPVRIVDVLRGAAAEVEDYTKIAVLTSSPAAVIGSAVADVIHLFAELMENATSFSPPNTEVHVMAETVGNGLAVEIEDRGLGIAPAKLEEINKQLANPPEFDLADTDQLGLFVVGRLAERHQIDVSLRRSPFGGTTAIALLPHTIVVPNYDPDQKSGEAEASGAKPTSAETPTPVLRNAAKLRQARMSVDAVRSGPARRQNTDAKEPTPWRQPAAAPKRATRPASTATPQRSTGSQPAVAPQRSTGSQPAVAPQRSTGSQPIVAPQRSTGSQPIVAPQRSTGSQPAVAPQRAGLGGPGNRQAGEPAGPPKPSSESSEPVAMHAGLPCRVRQKNLAPQLRGGDPAKRVQKSDTSERSPEEAGALIASMQAGWRRGRGEK